MVRPERHGCRVQAGPSRRRPRATLTWLLSSLAAVGCLDDDRALFEERVVPVLESRCAASTCHGVPAGLDGVSVDPRWFALALDDHGHLSDHDDAYRQAVARVNADDPALSTLLRRTLPVAQGGLAHFGGAVFPSRAHAAHVALEDFARATAGREDASEPPLTTLERRFQDEVYPVLVRRGCVVATCHGTLNFGGAVFPPPRDLSRPVLSRSELRHASTEARTNLTLWAHPLQARLVRKILPLEQGGIPHKGGNDVFLAAAAEAGLDPRDSDEVRALLGWQAAVRAEALGGDAPAAGALAGVVAVGGPLSTGAVFEPRPYVGPTALYRVDGPLPGGTVTDLTTAALGTEAEVRDPAVSHDGRMLAFSARRGKDDALNVYTLGVDGTGLRQLTRDVPVAGRIAHVPANMSPTFGPSGGRGTAGRLYFVSFRGDVGDAASVANSDLYVMDTDGGHPERLTWTVVPEVAPTFLAVGEFHGTVAYTIKRAFDAGPKGVLFRFPIDHDRTRHLQPEAHPHFGMSEPPQVFFGLRELPDGRGVMTLLDAANRTLGGQLAVLDRQFAVEVPEGAEATATLPGFRHALTNLTPHVTRDGLSPGGLWRDPVPLPDGAILAAHAPGPVDLNAPPADLRTDLVKITLRHERATQRPVLDTQTTWLSGDRAWSQPVPLVPRPLEDDAHERAWTNDDTPALIVHSGVDVVEALLAQLPPVGPRTVRTDLAALRLVAPLHAIASLDPIPVPAAETRDGHPGATTLSVSGHMPLFAAAEAALESDMSLSATVPPRVSVRVVTLDASGMATGALQPHWYALLPGERFPVGVQRTSFEARCAGCHGSMSGARGEVLGPPVDFLTQASVTRATHVDANRWRPRAPPNVTADAFRFADFRQDVLPLLERHCIHCHSGSAPAGGLSLTATPTTHYVDAYESLLTPGIGSTGGYRWVDAATHRARRSALVERLLGQELDAPRTVTGRCPPEAPLPEDARRILVRWIELGAPYRGRP